MFKAVSLFRLGLLSTEHVQLKGSPLKALCAHMEQLLKYNPGEQDAIYLNHFIGIKWPDNKVVVVFQF